MQRAACTLGSRGLRAAASVMLAGLLLAARDALAQGCAMCGSAFGEGDPLTHAFNWSILFLMATPYTLAGLIGGYLFYAHRRRSRRSRPAVIRFGRTGNPEGDLA